MLDIRLIRSDPDAVRTALARRGDVADDAIDRVLELDERWRGLTTELEELRAEQNRASKGRRGAPSPEEREQMAALAARGRELTDLETSVRCELDQLLLALPNPPLRMRRRPTPCCVRPAKPGGPAAIIWSWPAR